MSYKTIETKTIEILNFLKNKKIRPDLKFKIRPDINLKINRPLKPFIIRESELKSKTTKTNLIPPKSKTKSKPDLIPKSKPKTKSKPDLIPKSKPKTIDDNISKDPYNQFNPKAVKAILNEINNPLTKDILGIKKKNKKINNLTTEKVIVLTWIIRALIKN